MVFTRQKNDTSNQNRERCFFTCDKNDTSNQKPQRCVSFAPRFPPFIAACSAASREKFYSKSGKGKTKLDVSFCCAFCRSYFAFHLSLSLY